MNTNWMIEAAVAFLLWGAATGVALALWRRERRRRREAEAGREWQRARWATVCKQRDEETGRVARARIELCIVNVHLLKFPNAWDAPLKARPCVLRAIDILDGKVKRRV